MPEVTTYPKECRLRSPHRRRARDTVTDPGQCAATTQYGERYLAIYEAVGRSQSLTDLFIARACRDHRLPPKTITHLINHAKQIMTSEVTP